MPCINNKCKLKLTKTCWQQLNSSRQFYAMKYIFKNYIAIISDWRHLGLFKTIFIINGKRFISKPHQQSAFSRPVPIAFPRSFSYPNVLDRTKRSLHTATPTHTHPPTNTTRALQRKVRRCRGKFVWSISGSVHRQLCIHNDHNIACVHAQSEAQTSCRSAATSATSFVWAPVVGHVVPRMTRLSRMSRLRVLRMCENINSFDNINMELFR